MIPQRKRVQKCLFRSKVSLQLREQVATTAVFSLRAPKQQLSVWGPDQQRPISEKVLATRSEPDKNDQELIQVRKACLFPQNPEQSSVPIARRIEYFYQNWKVLTRDQWVLHLVQGLTLDFVQTPVQTHPPFQPSFNQIKTDLVDQEIKSMLEKRAIKVVKDQKGFLSYLFLVQKKGGGGQRPVVNLKELNGFLKYQHFKMEGIHLVKDRI